MIICIDFDGTIVSQDHAYDDFDTPLKFMPGAKEALLALKAAGHVLVLWSARSNLALRIDWRRNPLWASGAVLFDQARWEEQQPVNHRRYMQMLEFVEKELPGVFATIDDGAQGKFTGAQLFIDDRALRYIPESDEQGVDAQAGFYSWADLAEMYGAELPSSQDEPDDSPQKV